MNYGHSIFYKKNFKSKLSSITNVQKKLLKTKEKL